MSADFRIVAGQVIPALTISLPFSCDINLRKIFNPSKASISIKVFISQNGVLFCDQTAMNQSNVHWASLIEIARNCSEQNVILNRLNGSNQLQLCTTRSIAIDECLKLWPSANLLNEWNIPDYLQLANFIGINQYKCINCSKVYEEPNQLKIHSALSCNKLLIDSSKSRDNLISNDQQSTMLNKLTCNNLLDQYQTSSSHQPLKNSTTHIAFNPFTLSSSSLTPIKPEMILKTNLTSNSHSLNNHLLVNASSYQENINNSLNSLNGMNMNLINHNINNLITHHSLITSLSNNPLNNGLIANGLMNNNSMNAGSYLNSHSNHLTSVKRRKLDESNDLINALNKLNESQRDRPLDMSSNKAHLNGNQFNGLNQLHKLNGLNKSKDINLIDSDQSSDTTDELLNDKAVTSSSMSLLNINPPIKNRTMKLTKEPRTHTCRFCGKLYTRKYGLKIHIRTHTGHKPLKCIHCSRRFSDPSNLNKHQRLHDQHKQWNKQIDVKS